MKITGNIVSVEHHEIFAGEIHVEGNRIKKIVVLKKKPDPSMSYILPGFIDAHVHIESTMVTPQYFANHVVQFGTLGVVTDPHEISNVCGIEGFDYMYREGQKAPINIHFGIPSCVPATPFESSGAIFDPGAIEYLFNKYEAVALSEMMNFPGVVNGFPDVMKKLEIARKNNKVIDGHAPALRGQDLHTYIEAGISTDHEAFSYDEAKEKIKLGMMIQIREGSAARNFEALHELIAEYPDKVMFCTDDAHPDTLIQGHIDRIVKLAIKKGHSVFDVLKAASINTIQHYNLPIGQLKSRDYADFIVVNNLEELHVQESYLKGTQIFNRDKAVKKIENNTVVNQFHVDPVNIEQFKLKDQGKPVRVIQALDGALITKKNSAQLPVKDGLVQSDLENDILKMVVVNRYQKVPELRIGFITGFNLKKGAFASSIAHDSHNLICVGTNDHDMLMALNTLIAEQGGISTSVERQCEVVPLPVAGLMANETIDNMAVKYKKLDQNVKKMGSKFEAPFMTLAFMSLLVIPSLKLGDKGLFDVDKFEFVDLFID